MPRSGVGMKNTNKKITIYLDSYLSNWLEAKALKGYKKASLIRHIMAQYVKNGADSHGD
jgi:hypothetical protein